MLLMPLFQIGELAGALSDEYVVSARSVPWQALRGFRNSIAHDYGIVDPLWAWNSIEADIPSLRAFLEKELEAKRCAGSRCCRICAWFHGVVYGKRPEGLCIRPSRVLWCIIARLSRFGARGLFSRPNGCFLAMTGSIRPSGSRTTEKGSGIMSRRSPRRAEGHHSSDRWKGHP